MLMSSLNYGRPVLKVANHAGLKVKEIKPEDQLVRLTLAHMLWEDQFYVDGKTAADSIVNLVPKCSPEFVMNLAHKARTDFKLRHVPLLLTRELVRTGKATAEGINNVIQRPDEMSELLSIYWKDGKSAISTQLKKGLALAFSKFPEYSLAKWDKNSAAISMRDVMFLVHPKPESEKQAEMFKRVANKELKTPDTWEVALSGGADKKDTFERLMDEGNLGALAFLRNLRNMVQAGVDERIMREFAKTLDVSKVLPFRFLAAARVVPQFEDMLEEMMLKSCTSLGKLKGKTRVIVDVSGSMFGARVSSKSDLDRFDAAAALAVIMREVCEDVEIWSFSHDAVRVPPRRGFALVEAIRKSQQHGGTTLGNSMRTIYAAGKADRDIVITDGQTSDKPMNPQAKGYMLDIASYQNGVNQDAWTNITGFSEAVVQYIFMMENQ
jgi:60 kDa SS-A/Ro ribonucleoprotein